ncbi:uncharacterized protein LOC117177530 [Belonocnema kinseyi]|uniref:uncharacterized protein LOC117177530 n=1 Tax=Belonocnema kinseyi TaxID=2817044 RepID=UPI00143DA09A|nr:uncharacterized protein LOC117177530 [Belonocnema kinseyi]
MSDSEQHLFLIEFLVERVNIPSVRAMHDKMLPVTTCVSFQILSLPPVNIEQESDSEGCVCIGGDSQIFNKGKSCLFALPTIVLEKPLYSFPIIMSVYKKLPPGVLPDVMLIGTHQIQAKNLINAVLSNRVFKSRASSKTSKDTYKITTATGQAVGEVTVFLRVSCFGRKIVTQFQIPHNKKPFLFKGEENSPVIQCKKIPSQTECKDSNLPKCMCKPENRGSFGAGEAPRNCCLAPPSSPVSIKSVRHKTPDENLRPCCPSLRNPGKNEYSGKSPMIVSGSCPRLKQKQYQQANNFQVNESTVRKCGSTVKMEKRCDCS